MRSYTSETPIELSSLINAEELRSYYKNYINGGQEVYRFWEALCLVMWFKNYNPFSS